MVVMVAEVALNDENLAVQASVADLTSSVEVATVEILISAQKCIRRLVLIVARRAKFHFVQTVRSQSIVTIVSVVNERVVRLKISVKRILLHVSNMLLDRKAVIDALMISKNRLMVYTLNSIEFWK